LTKLVREGRVLLRKEAAPEAAEPVTDEAAEAPKQELVAPAPPLEPPATAPPEAEKPFLPELVKEEPAADLPAAPQPFAEPKDAPPAAFSEPAPPGEPKLPDAVKRILARLGQGKAPPPKAPWRPPK
jgi:hypothetical protein